MQNRKATFSELRFFLATLLLVLPTVTAFSAQEEPSYYHFELVVFAQPASSAAEDFSAEPIIPADANNNSPYQWHDSSVYRLEGAIARLRQSGRTPLLHRAWTQAGVRHQLAPMLNISAITKDFALQGQIQIHRDRYLFAALDLVLDDQNGQRYQLRETRRMRSKELHYFDHPRLGALLIAYPVDDSKS